MLPFYNKVLEDSKFRLGTITRMPAFASNLYTFTYRSKEGHDAQPFVMLIQSQKSGTSIYRAKNGFRYMLAINLNYVTSPETRSLLIRKLSNKGPITWNHALMIGRFFTAKQETMFGAANPGMLRPLVAPLAPHQDAGITRFRRNAARYFIRQYDVRKLRDLSVVDATKYLEKSGASPLDVRLGI